MTQSLKVLILEDSMDDVALIERELQRAGITFSAMVVKNRLDFENALNEFRPQVILSDHAMPDFNSIEALNIYKEFESKTCIKLPFILVTGAVSEEFAVQCIKAGADDYILKDRIKRLPASIQNALEKTRLEAEKQEYLQEVIANEARMRESERLAHLGSWEIDLASGKNKWSDEAYRLLGYEPGKIEPGYEKLLNHVHPEDLEFVKKKLDDAIRHLDHYTIRYRIIDTKGQIKYLRSQIVIHRSHLGLPVKLGGFVIDVTELIKHTHQIEEQNEKLKEIAWFQSHGVRAPLARLMGLVSIMRTYKDESTDPDVILEMVAEAASDLDNLIRSVVRKTEELSDGELIDKETFI